MFKKYLQTPLTILWIAIIFIRMSLDQLVLLKPDAGQWFDFISAIFIAAVPIAEAAIFFRAFRAYLNSPPIAIQSSGLARLAGKILLPLFFFCLPYGLWNSRRSIIEVMASTPGGRWIEIGGLAAACAFNLFISGSVVHSILATHCRPNQAVQ
jgi:hypothetical protein